MSLKSDKANLAMENYLDDLFNPDSEPPSAPAKPVKSNKGQKKQFQLGTENTSVSAEQRHQIERVERLLDDYNQRQSTTTDVSDKISLLRPVLEPEITVEEEHDTEYETEADEVVNETPVTQEDPPLVIQSNCRATFEGKEFQALMFNVAGMDIAVPLISLGGINRMDKEVTQLFGKPDWFLGLTPGINGNINVVDSCRWVMPERYGEAKSKGLNYSFIIMLGDTQWGLACSHVQNAVTIDPDNIKWRSQDSKRPWLAGMLIEERCVLLDVDVMIELLDSDYQR